MKKILLSFSFLFLFITFSSAQVAILKSTTFVDSVSQPGLKKYGVKLSFDGINVPVIYETISYPDSTHYYGDSIPNLLNSSSSLIDINSFSFKTSAKNANNTTQTILEIYGHPMDQNIVNFPLISSSNGLSCDGLINTNIDTSKSNIYINMPIFLTNSTAYPMPFPTSSYTVCSGAYSVIADYDLSIDKDFVVDSSVNISTWYGILIGQYAFPSMTGLGVDVNTYQDATSPTCDGKARVSVLNSNIPFLCAFDGGGYSSSDSITNLCEGIHSVLVVTANDTVGKYFIISNANNVTNNTNPYGTVVDTIVYNFTNCNFDYNLPIDSAFLLNYNIIDSNTVFFSWEIWQSGTLTAVSDTISYNYQSGNNMVSLMIFCGNARTSSANSIKTFRINDYAYLSNTTTTIKDKQQNSNFELYPNPFSSSISIKAKDKLTIKNMELYNLLGDKININYQSNSQETVLDTEHLKPGFYIISLISQSGQKNTYKVIKQ